MENIKPRCLADQKQIAGKEMAHVRDAAQSVHGKITGVIGKIPVVGSPIKTIMNAGFHAATMPGDIVVDAALKGGRIDRVVMNHLSQAVKETKAVAPYAQMVVSMVPGIGTGASAALGAGIALANGQPIDKAIMAGVVGAVPGGPIAQAAAKVGMSAVSAAIHHEKFDIKGAALEGVSVLPGGQLVQAAAKTGLNAADAAVHHKKFDVSTAMSAAADALPIPAQAKAALKQGVEMTAAIASGKKVDAAVADAALKAGMAYLSPAAKKAFQSGLGVATGAIMQQVKNVHLPDIKGKLEETGAQLAKNVPAIAEARKLAGNGAKGFDIGHGMLSHVVSASDIAHMREHLKGPDKRGFDMALASKSGMVAHPPRHDLSPAAQAGKAIAHGLHGMNHPENQQAIMSRLHSHPSASVGAKTAMAQIGRSNESWPVRVVKTIKAGFKHMLHAP